MPEIELADNAEALILKVPYSDISRYDKTGWMKELAKTVEPAKVEVNPVKRFVVATAGIFFLMVGLMGFGGGANTLVSIVCIVFGLLIIWTFIARPEMQKRKAAASPSNTKNPEVSMIFGKQNIIMRSAHNELRKDWSELAEYRKTKKGMHFNFSDGTEAYLPLDAFYEGEQKALATLLQSKKIT